MFPATDREEVTAKDTAHFTRRLFNRSYYSDKVNEIAGKHIIQPVTGKDFRAFAASPDQYYLYFLNAHCFGAPTDVRWCDSLARTGKNVILISLPHDYQAIDKLLSGSVFNQYPYYTIEDKVYSRRVLKRMNQFIADLCPSCYEKYRDDLQAPDFYILQNGNIEFHFDRRKTVVLPTVVEPIAK